MAYNKYGAKKAVCDGITFDSRAEMFRYTELKLLQQGGAISKLVLQPAFEIIPKQDGEKGARYRADFQYNENGRIVVEDVKSEITAKKPDYILRRKLFKLTHPQYIFREKII